MGNARTVRSRYGVGAAAIAHAVLRQGHDKKARCVIYWEQKEVPWLPFL
ncbi:MAG: hypothetical protein HDR38_06050 [Treponema sp.]|nr:hypothetical protein [Treponema sp.]